LKFLSILIVFTLTFSVKTYSQIDFRASIEMGSEILWKRGFEFNQTDYQHNHNFSSGRNYGIQFLKKLKNKNLRLGLAVDSRSFSSTFSVLYDQFVPDDELIQIRYNFQARNVKMSLVSEFEHRNWKFSFLHGFEIPLIETPYADFFEGRIALDGTGRHITRREVFNGHKGGWTSQISVDYKVWNKFFFGLRLDYVKRSSGIYNLWIASNQHNWNSNNLRPVVSIGLSRPKMSIGWRVSYHFSAFKKKKKGG